jgi:hypothetical protein
VAPILEPELHTFRIPPHKFFAWWVLHKPGRIHGPQATESAHIRVCEHFLAGDLGLRSPTPPRHTSDFARNDKSRSPPDVGLEKPGRVSHPQPRNARKNPAQWEYPLQSAAHQLREIPQIRKMVAASANGKSTTAPLQQRSPERAGEKHLCPEKRICVSLDPFRQSILSLGHRLIH